MEDSDYLFKMHRVDINEIPNEPPFIAMASYTSQMEVFEKSIGTYHRSMDENDIEPGPSVYWYFVCDCGFAVSIIHALHKHNFIVAQTDYCINHLYHHLRIPLRPDWVNPEPKSYGLTRGYFTNAVDYNLYRQDDNGNNFCLEPGISRLYAECLLREYESMHHKQIYWINPSNHN
ncbi:MAG: hypothetical protein U0Y96_01970 [Candidatus Kapaibacterium sp.]